MCHGSESIKKFAAENSLSSTGLCNTFHLSIVHVIQDHMSIPIPLHFILNFLVQFIEGLSLPPSLLVPPSCLASCILVTLNKWDL